MLRKYNKYLQGLYYICQIESKTKEPERMKECIEYLQNFVNVIQKPNIHQKFIIIDNRIVWYGSINLLSYGNAEESIMRLESRELACELAGLVVQV